MTIRNAEEKDIPRILDLLGQVLELHARILIVYLNKQIATNCRMLYLHVFIISYIF